MARLRTVRAALVAVGFALVTGGCPPVVLTPSEAVWVADSLNSRVLLIKYTQPFIPEDPVQCPNPTVCNANYGHPIGSAVGVIGQPDFVSSNPGTSSTSLRFPTGIALDPTGNLWVVDWYNNRVLEFAKSSISGSSFFAPSAVQVVGQPDFVTVNGGDPAANNFGSAQGIAFDKSGNLYVSDTNYCRVLMFPAKSLGVGRPNQPDATLVLGQPDFNTACKSAFGNVQGISFDGNGNLWAAASTGIFEFTYGAGFQSGQLATPVITSGTTKAVLFSSPFGITVVNGNIWVSDGCNPYFYCATAYNRVIELAPQNGSWSNPQVVSILGQGTIPAVSPGDPTNSEGNMGGDYPSPGTLAAPTFVTFDSGGNLFVADSGNNRVTEYVPAYAQSPPACSTGLVCPVAGTIYTGDNATFIIGEKNGWTSCNGTGRVTCFNGSAYQPPATSQTTLSQPTGIIPITFSGG